MKKLLSLVSILTLLSFVPDWGYNLDEAKAKASKENKVILLNFSGSDWCGPCNKMRKEIFENEAFNKYASKNLILVNADFPRLKKNQLDQKQQAHNNIVAEKYNTKGAFPFTVLLDASGNIIGQWDGYPKGTSDDFIEQVKERIESSKQ
jgi:thioredoxin-related protein